MGTAIFAFGAYRLDAGERLLYRAGEPVPPTPKALDTLLVLAEGYPRLVTKDDLLARV